MNISPPSLDKHPFTDDTRGITWTIEAFLSVSLLLGILFFTLTSFPTPDPGAQQLAAQETQNDQTGQDILAGLDATNQLVPGLLYVDPTTTTTNSPAWHDPTGDKLTPSGDYSSFPTNHPHHDAFSFLTENNVLYNVELVYQETTSSTSTAVPIVYQGVPGQNAVVVEYTAIIDEDDVLLDSDGTPITGDQCNGVSGTDPVTLGDAEGSSNCNYFMDRVFDEDTTSRYNIARVRLTLWN